LIFKGIFMKKLFALLSIVVASQAFAQTTNNQPQPPHHEMNPAVKAALEACASTVQKDANGRPNHEAMRACMQAKGFNPPEHHEHGQGGQPPQQQ
jgi:hypothetical protein